MLVGVSHDIWDDPELCFEEHHAHDLLCDVLDEHGLAPTRHAYGLDTAFVAEAGTEGPAHHVVRVAMHVGLRDFASALEPPMWTP